MIYWSMCLLYTNQFTFINNSQYLQPISISRFNMSNNIGRTRTDETWSGRTKSIGDNVGRGHNSPTFSASLWKILPSLKRQLVPTSNAATVDCSSAGVGDRLSDYQVCARCLLYRSLKQGPKERDIDDAMRIQETMVTVVLRISFRLCGVATTSRKVLPASVGTGLYIDLKVSTQNVLLFWSSDCCWNVSLYEIWSTWSTLNYR